MLLGQEDKCQSHVERIILMETQNRFLRTMLYMPVGRIPDIEFGYWPQTIKPWHKEGLPESKDGGENE
jgi:hypothetical protein